MSKLTVEEQIIEIARVRAKEIDEAKLEERPLDLWYENPGVRDIILGFPNSEESEE